MARCTTDKKRHMVYSSADQSSVLHIGALWYPSGRTGHTMRIFFQTLQSLPVKADQARNIADKLYTLAELVDAENAKGK